MKVCFIAHPVAGDVEGNIKKITAILRRLNLEQPDIVPFAPYIADLLALKDETPDERVRGIANSNELFNRLFIDELWLYGDRISNGMIAEIELANQLGIKIVPMTPETEEKLRREQG